MSWKAIFRYNGRLEGGRQEIVRELEDRPGDAVIAEMEREAVRRNGSIFVSGWSVEWVDPPLDDPCPDCELAGNCEEHPFG